MSLELGGGQSPKSAEGVRGWSWQSSETASEWKTGHPLTAPVLAWILVPCESVRWDDQGEHLTVWETKGLDWVGAIVYTMDVRKEAGGSTSTN